MVEGNGMCMVERNRMCMVLQALAEADRDGIGSDLEPMVADSL